MTYARINIKCNEGLVNDLHSIIPFYGTGKIYVRDFFAQVLNMAEKVLAYAKFRNPGCDVNTEFYVFCPLSVYQEAQDIMENMLPNYSDLYLLMEHISKLDVEDFVA